MKKISWFLLAMPFCASAAQSPFDGFYAGSQLGMVYGYFHHTSSASVDGTLFPFPAPDTPASSSSDHSSNLGADAGLHLGYGHVFNWFYIGAEVNGDFEAVHADAHSINSPSNADNNVTTTYSARLTNSYGVTLRPGYLISPTLMLYLKGGIQGSHFKASTTTGFDPDLASSQPSYFVTAGGSKEVLGWQAGIGLEKRAKNHFGFRIEDLFSGYQGISATTQQSFVDARPGHHPPGTVTATTHILPFTNTVMVGVDYYFG